MAKRSMRMKDGVLAPTETQIQCAFIEMVRVHEPVYRDLKFLFHVPNGQMRTPAIAALLKRMGVRRGPVDIWLPVGRSKYRGLAAEFKCDAGEKLTKEQQEFSDRLTIEGWYVAKWFDAEQAWKDLKWYITLEH